MVCGFKSHYPHHVGAKSASLIIPTRKGGDFSYRSLAPPSQPRFVSPDSRLGVDVGSKVSKSTPAPPGFAAAFSCPPHPLCFAGHEGRDVLDPGIFLIYLPGLRQTESRCRILICSGFFLIIRYPWQSLPQERRPQPAQK